MSKAAGQPSTNTVEHSIKLDALEHVLKETNPLVHELYLGTIENLQAQEAAEVNRVLTQTLKSMPTERQQFLDHCNLLYLYPSPVEDRNIRRRKRLRQPRVMSPSSGSAR